MDQFEGMVARLWRAPGADRRYRTCLILIMHQSVTRFAVAGLGVVVDTVLTSPAWLRNAAEQWRAYRRAAALRREDAELLLQLGLAVDGQGRWDEGANAPERARRQVLDDSRVLYALGETRLHRGQDDAALAAVRQAMQAAPQTARLHYDAGFALARLRRWSEAPQALRGSRPGSG